MEDYFNQPLDDLRKDERPLAGQSHFQVVGFTERATAWVANEPCTQTTCSLVTIPPAVLDISTRRFLWHMNETQSPALNSSNVVPSADFLRERWTGITDQWGQSMKNA
jgi:hypothetical protein